MTSERFELKSVVFRPKRDFFDSERAVLVVENPKDWFFDNWTQYLITENFDNVFCLPGSCFFLHDAVRGDFRLDKHREKILVRLLSLASIDWLRPLGNVYSTTAMCKRYVHQCLGPGWKLRCTSVRERGREMMISSHQHTHTPLHPPHACPTDPSWVAPGDESPANPHPSCLPAWPP